MTLISGEHCLFCLAFEKALIVNLLISRSGMSFSLACPI